MRIDRCAPRSCGAWLAPAGSACAHGRDWRERCGRAAALRTGGIASRGRAARSWNQGQRRARRFRREALPAGLGSCRDRAGSSGRQLERFGLLPRRRHARARGSVAVGIGRTPRSRSGSNLYVATGATPRDVIDLSVSPPVPAVRPLRRPPPLGSGGARLGAARGPGGSERVARVDLERPRCASSSPSLAPHAPPGKRSNALALLPRAHAVRRPGGEQRGGRGAPRRKGYARRGTHPRRMVSQRGRRRWDGAPSMSRTEKATASGANPDGTYIAQT